MMVDLYGTCYFDKCSAQFWFNFLFIFWGLVRRDGFQVHGSKESNWYRVTLQWTVAALRTAAATTTMGSSSSSSSSSNNNSNKFGLMNQIGWTDQNVWTIWLCGMIWFKRHMVHKAATTASSNNKRIADIHAYSNTSKMAKPEQQQQWQQQQQQQKQQQIRWIW